MTGESFCPGSHSILRQRFLEKKVAQEPQDSNKAGGFDGSGTPGPQQSQPKSQRCEVTASSQKVTESHLNVSPTQSQPERHSLKLLLDEAEDVEFQIKDDLPGLICRSH